MRRRPSGSPVEKEAVDYLAIKPTTGGTSGTATILDTHHLQVELPAPPEPWEDTSDGGSQTPGSRSTTSSRDSVTLAVASEKLDKGRRLVAPRESQGKVRDRRKGQNSHRRNPRLCSPLTLVTTAVAFCMLFVILHSSFTRQLDPQGCVMSWMSATYLKLSGFDTEFTRFATKYSLYLYREEGVDEYNQANVGVWCPNNECSCPTTDTYIAPRGASLVPTG